jgi:hypothetical protein
MGKRTSTFLMIAVVAVIMLFVVFLVNRTYIFQEGNPLPVFNGIYKIVMNKQPYEQIDNEPIKYIARTDKHDELFAFIEKTYGVKYKEEKGSGYHFEGDGKSVVLTQRQYSRSFQVWILTQQ